MLRKKLLITILISVVAITTAVLVPTVMLSGESDSMSVTRMYSDSLEGPWSMTSSSSTRYVQEITVVDGQKTIVIQEVDFIWEAPEGTFVFVGQKGEKGDTGPQGPQGECPFPDNFNGVQE